MARNIFSNKISRFICFCALSRVSPNQRHFDIGQTFCLPMNLNLQLGVRQVHSGRNGWSQNCWFEFELILALSLSLSLSFCFDTVCSLLSHYGGLITRWNLIRLNIVAHTTHSKHDFIFYAISSSWYCFIITIYVDFISSFRMICVHSSAAEAPTKFISMEFVYSFFSLNGIPKFFVQKCHSQNDHLRITPATFDDRLSIQYDIIRIAVP